MLPGSVRTVDVPASDSADGISFGYGGQWQDAVYRPGSHNSSLLRLASQNPLVDPWLNEQVKSFTPEGMFEALASGGRMAVFDTLVGLPSQVAEAAFNETGHGDAALLLKEFRLGEGPQHHDFGPSDTFTQGFVASETTQEHIQRALADWRGREGGLYARNGTYTNYAATFLPLGAGNVDAGVPFTLVGTPEAHVIGSFGLDGRIVGKNVIQWTASNEMSLKSYFAENWTRKINVSVVENNYRPQKYGNTSQSIIWRTDFNGRRIK